MKIIIDICGTEEQCREKQFQARWPTGCNCPRCGHTKRYQVSTRNLYQCGNRRYKCSITTDTILSSPKLPPTIWFLRSFFIAQPKEGLSTLILRGLLRISAYAAMRIKHSRQQLIRVNDDSLVLKGLVEFEDAYRGGNRSGGKRSRGESGKIHFLATITHNEKGHSIDVRMSKVKSFSFLKVGKWSLNYTHPERIVIPDERCSLRELSTMFFPWTYQYKYDL